MHGRCESLLSQLQTLRLSWTLHLTSASLRLTAKSARLLARSLPLCSHLQCLSLQRVAGLDDAAVEDICEEAHMHM